MQTNDLATKLSNQHIKGDACLQCISLNHLKQIIETSVNLAIAPWCDLPPGVLSLVAQHLPDEASFLLPLFMVCQSWRQVRRGSLNLL